MELNTKQFNKLLKISWQDQSFLSDAPRFLVLAHGHVLGGSAPVPKILLGGTKTSSFRLFGTLVIMVPETDDRLTQCWKTAFNFSRRTLNRNNPPGYIECIAAFYTIGLIVAYEHSAVAEAWVQGLLDDRPPYTTERTIHRSDLGKLALVRIAKNAAMNSLGDIHRFEELLKTQEPFTTATYRAEAINCVQSVKKSLQGVFDQVGYDRKLDDQDLLHAMREV